LCRGLLRDAHEAEDAAQQAFLSVHGAFLRGAEPDDPARWLAAIARNECLTRIRDRMRHPLPLADAGETASRADPVAEAVRRADLRALWRAIGALAPQQRDALLLREFGGLTYDELAVALGVSVPAVESLLFRARARLRFELKAAAAALGGLLPRLLTGGGPAKVAGVTVAAGILTGGVLESEHRLAHHPIPAPAAPHLSRVLPDLPPATAPSPAARPIEHAPPHPRPAPIVFAPSAPAEAPTADSPRENESLPTSADEERTPVVATEEPSATTLPDEASSGGDGSAGLPPPTATTESSGGGDSTTTTTTMTSEDGAGTSGS